MGFFWLLSGWKSVWSYMKTCLGDLTSKVLVAIFFSIFVYLAYKWAHIHIVKWLVAKFSRSVLKISPLSNSRLHVVPIRALWGGSWWRRRLKCRYSPHESLISGGSWWRRGLKCRYTPHEEIFAFGQISPFVKDKFSFGVHHFSNSSIWVVIKIGDLCSYIFITFRIQTFFLVFEL